MSQIVGMLIVAMFPWTLAAVGALVSLAGADTQSDREQQTNADYQPMRMLTSRAAHAA